MLKIPSLPLVIILIIFKQHEGNFKQNFLI